MSHFGKRILASMRYAPTVQTMNQSLGKYKLRQKLKSICDRRTSSITGDNGQGLLVSWVRKIAVRGSEDEANPFPTYHNLLFSYASSFDHQAWVGQAVRLNILAWGDLIAPQDATSLQ